MNTYFFFLKKTKTDDAFVHAQSFLKCDSEWHTGVHRSFKEYVG